MTKLKTYWYDQWDKGQPRPLSTSCRPRRIAITLATWRTAPPHITLAHPINPDLTVQFSRN